MAKEFKRVKDKRTGHEYSVVNVDKENHEVLDKPAVGRNGKPLPAKPMVRLPRAGSGQTQETEDNGEQKAVVTGVASTPGSTTERGKKEETK